MVVDMVAHVAPALRQAVSLSSSRAALVVASAASATPLDATAAVGKKREYLVWEPGFGARFLGSVVVICAIAQGAQRSNSAWLIGMELQAQFAHTLQVLAHRLEWWSLLGLLSSSCCLLQLILNAFSVGCAGFNTLLGPLRPYFLALTAFLQFTSWRTALVTGRGPTLVTTALAGSLLSFVLALLPEALHWYVHRPSRGALPPTDAAAAVPAELCLRVSGMGCTACTAKVKSALEGVAGVSAATVNLEGESAVLQLAPDAARADASSSEGSGAEGSASSAVEARCIVALEQAGFGATPDVQGATPLKP